MLLINDPLRQTDLPRGCVTTIGNFDGTQLLPKRELTITQPIPSLHLP